MNGSGRISAVVPLLALTALLAGCATPFQKRLAEAQKGDCRAQYDVALCYATGRGVGPKGTKGDPSPEEAVRWLEQAADKDGEACLALGLFHYYRRGVRDDWDSYQKAFYHIRRASERNVPGALYWLGECYLKGRGVDQDVKKAIDCFRKCAEQTDRAPVQAAASMAKIGHCYLHGTGGHADYVQCRDWFRKAKDAGDKGAAEMLKKLSQAYFNKVQGLGDDSDGGNADSSSSGITFTSSPVRRNTTGVRGSALSNSTPRSSRRKPSRNTSRPKSTPSARRSSPRWRTETSPGARCSRRRGASGPARRSGFWS